MIVYRNSQEIVNNTRKNDQTRKLLKFIYQCRYIGSLYQLFKASNYLLTHLFFFLNAPPSCVYQVHQLDHPSLTGLCRAAAAQPRVDG